MFSDYIDSIGMYYTQGTYRDFKGTLVELEHILFMFLDWMNSIGISYTLGPYKDSAGTPQGF
jgi:hypothetical protein